jgi:hypothetical protein
MAEILYAMPHITSCDTKASKLVPMYVKEIQYNGPEETTAKKCDPLSILHSFPGTYVQF